MGNVRLYGATSGYTELAPPAVAPDGVLSLPSGTGTLLTAEGGKILQVVRATDTTNRETTSASFVDVTGMSVTITPQKSTSRIILICSVQTFSLWSVGDNGRGSLQITDASNNVISGGGNSTIGLYNITGTGSRNVADLVTIFAQDEPATISAVTYKLRFNSASANNIMRIANSEQTGQLYAIEVSA
jgi:hypothetical protein